MQCKEATSFWGPMVLGMHDAIVSTIGLVTGLVFADAHQYAIILTAIIASVAAGLSMAASSYLADRADNKSGIAKLRGAATGTSYVFTAAFLIVPFIFIKNTFYAVLMCYLIAVSIIWFFNFVKSRLCGEKFWPKFLEMLTICAIVTASAFIIGECAKICFGIEI